MTKKSRKENDQDDMLGKVQRRLARAQLALHVAQERRTEAIAKGEADIQRARRKAAERETKATTRVEKRAAQLTRAEADLHTFDSARQSEPDGHGGPSYTSTRAEEPESHDLLEIVNRETQQAEDSPGDSSE